ncbi:MAG TPA: TauD/TfdA family dioxygenase [Thermoanaerobaculia bacterium]|nr:TauD/TfdA family dioxygenase [Thermoanaerobaculia bacterium]
MQPSIPLLTTTDPRAIWSALCASGGVLVRAACAGEEDFESLTSPLLVPMVHHATSTIERDAVNADATTSTVNKGMDEVPLHREGSYAPGSPDILALYCVRPASERGETTLCDGVLLRDALPDGVRDFVDRSILMWRWTAPPERWQATLQAHSKDSALLRLDALRKRLPPWERLETEFHGDDLEGRFFTPCVVPVKWGTRRSFCNSLLIHRFREASDYFARHLLDVRLSDGTAFPESILEELARVAEECTYEVTWREGDVLFIDNTRCMHGRRAFSDPARRILIRMGHAVEALQP